NANIVYFSLHLSNIRDLKKEYPDLLTSDSTYSELSLRLSDNLIEYYYDEDWKDKGNDNEIEKKIHDIICKYNFIEENGFYEVSDEYAPHDVLQLTITYDNNKSLTYDGRYGITIDHDAIRDLIVVFKNEFNE
ncbi:MAG: hypothetical protein HUJ53_07780, partial [Holdemanella sp.]|nr:hypothetical protein [Holdemanella sp.]